MNEMKNLNFNEGGEGMDAFGDSLTGLLKGLTQSLGMQGVIIFSFSPKDKK